MKVETLEGSRVKAIVDVSIMVSLKDVVVGDILYVIGTEDDPIIEEIRWDGTKVKFLYKPSNKKPVMLGGKKLGPITESIWMETEEPFPFCFIHDLKKERDPYL